MTISRAQRFLRAMSGYRQVWVVTHDYPDPDAIATGWALYWLVKQRLDVPCRLIGGGEIARAENRELVRLLSPPLELVTDIELAADTATVLVDANPASQNHLLARVPVLPQANIDHHRGNPGQRAQRDKERPAFCDVRPGAAATVSIAASYLRELAVEPSKLLATAMLYAIRTETLGYETHFSRLDQDILPWITERADPSKMAEIENAPLPHAYFSDLALALQNAFIYEDAVLCLLPRAEGPETVAEVADLLVRGEGVRRVMCGALVGHDVMLSVRTGIGAGDAGALARQVLAGIGNAGGHEHRAGGKIPSVADVDHIGSELQQELRKRFLAACGIERKRGMRLVARREIVSHL